MPRIIIIDDELDNVKSTECLLKLMGIDVIAVGYNGKDAVELYEKHKPDVVLLDMMMPEYDGFYAIDGIDKLDPHAKVIILSGILDSKTNEMVKHRIVHSLVIKPFVIDDLIKKILN